jgi:multicomponent Na+:H+ antiporter subunit D
MTLHLPALLVVLPLVAAPLCVLVRAPLAAWAIFGGASLFALGASLVLLEHAAAGGVIRYAMGGWAPPFGIEYVVDAANAFVLVLVALVSSIMAVYARRSIEAEIEGRRVYLYYACLSLNLAGLLGIVATGDAFNVFVFLEISSLSSYVLIALGRRRQALLAAFQYLVLGTIGATFFLIGIGLVYALTGTLNMADLAVRLAALPDSRTLVAAVAFVAVGMAVKMALFPLHSWLPGAYGEAPSAASAFLAATGTKVSIYAFLRLAFTVFGAALVFERLPGRDVGLVLGSAAMLAGSAVACLQQDLKRLLAWSSVAQIGYIVVGFSLASAPGLTAAFLHVFNHALIKCALFCAAGAVLLRLGAVQIDALAGLGRRMPGTFAVIVISGLGLIGVPFTAGFVSKWALVQALVAEQAWAVVAAVLFSSLLAVVYVGRVVEAGWFREPPAGAPPAVPASMVAATWMLVALNLYLGLDSAALGHYAEAAARALLAGVGT